MRHMAHQSRVLYSSPLRQAAQSCASKSGITMTTMTTKTSRRAAKVM